MKRILSAIIVLTLMLSLVPLSGFAATDAVVYTEASTSEVYPGDSFTYSISLSGTYDGYSLEFSKEQAGLTITSVTGEAGVYVDDRGNTWMLSVMGGLNKVGSAKTKLATVTVSVDVNAATGTKEIGFTNIAVSNDIGDRATYATEFANVVVISKPVAATGVTLNKESVSLKTGESEILIATVSPDNATNKTISWKSSDTTIATVDNNGKVEAVKKGSATVTVTTEDGGFTDTCTVNVACSHANKTPIAEKASDCKNQGWDAYVKCDDCGQLFAENGTTEIAEIPFRPLSQQHTGGTATCTTQAVCTVCGNPYGNTLAHSYTAETKKAEALKTEGNCRDKAVYWYSCSACGDVERDDNHTFFGDKVAATHVGGTTIVNAAEPNHETQVGGYTGDTKCLGCGEIITYGQPIEADAHTPANVWSADGEYHWKECTVVGCGIVIDGSKAAHTSTGANAATCQKQAVCDVCGVSYGAVAAHDWNTSAWEKDASGHWHKCNTAGCTEKNDFAGHTPDHEGGATEEYPIKCTVCGWIIEQQLAHDHVFDKEVAQEQYMASGATCLKPAAYYKSCACGEKGTETFEYGSVIDHTEGTEWKSDEDSHWHICTAAGCGVVIGSSKAAHTPDRDAATETDPIKCSVCGYVITPALGHTHNTTKVEGYDATCTEAGQKAYYVCEGCGKWFEGAAANVEIADWNSVVIPALGHDWKEATCTEPKTCQRCGATEGEANGHTESGWLSDATEHWKVCTVEGCGVEIENSREAHGDEDKDGECDVCAYEVSVTDPSSPQTGDTGNTLLWTALLLAGGAGIITVTYSRKKKYTAN